MKIKPPSIEVKSIKGKGRGVFASKNFVKGEAIEDCPVLVCPGPEVLGEEGSKDTKLSDYAFAWDDNKGTVAIALGYGSLYNHSYTPNAYYEDAPGPLKMIIAHKNIKAGEEITINYNAEPDDKTPVWFDVK